MITQEKNWDALEEKLGYAFKDKSFLNKALTHPSVLASSKASEFERYEFLGDRVLGVIISHWLIELFPTEKEGDLAKRLAHLVCKQALLHHAQDLELQHFLYVDNVESLQNSSILADAMEALIAAIYLDSDLTAAQNCVRRWWQPLMEESLKPILDAKSLLQEIVQKKGYEKPDYTIISREGPSHAPIFQLQVEVPGIHIKGHGTGTNKRDAEKQAAEDMINKLKNIRLTKRKTSYS